MASRHVALGNRNEARQARFGGEQVITVGIEAAFRNPIPDREELTRRVEEKTELHRVEHFLGQFAERLETSPERPRGACGALESIDQSHPLAA